MADDNPNPNPAPPAVPPGFVPNAEMHAAIEKARLEERDKLRTRIETAETKATTLEGENKKLTDANAALTTQLTDVTAKYDTLVKNTAPDGKAIDINAVIEQSARNAAAAAEAAFKPTIEALQSEVQTLRQKDEEVNRTALRTRLIQEAGGEGVLVASLVTGNNEVELRSSIEKNKAAFAETLAKAGLVPGGAAPAGGTTAPVNLPAPAGAGAGKGAGSGADPIGNAKEMSMEDYAKNRETLLKGVTGRYKGVQ